MPFHIYFVLNESLSLIVLFIQFQVVKVYDSVLLTIFTTNNHTIEKHGIIFAQCDGRYLDVFV
jgi:hypothetical protein